MENKTNCARCGAQLKRYGQVDRNERYGEYDVRMKISRGCAADYWSEGSSDNFALCAECWHAINLWLTGHPDAELDRIWGRVSSGE